MTKELMLTTQENIERKIFLIRGKKILLDHDLAILYGVKTHRLNEQGIAMLSSVLNSNKAIEINLASEPKGNNPPQLCLGLIYIINTLFRILKLVQNTNH